jgi:hypothetical protein
VVCERDTEFFKAYRLIGSHPGINVYLYFYNSAIAGLLTDPWEYWPVPDACRDHAFFEKNSVVKKNKFYGIQNMERIFPP